MRQEPTSTVTRLCVPPLERDSWLCSDTALLAFIEHYSKTAKPFKWVYDAKRTAA